MNRTCTRLALFTGLFCILLVSSGGFSCHAESKDPVFYIPPKFDLHVHNDDSAEVNVYVDDVYQDFAEPYQELVITGVNEHIDTELFAEAVDGSGDWGPDIVDTRGLDDYDWALDPSEWFTLTVNNFDPLYDAYIYVDDQDCGPVLADDWASIIEIPTNELTKIEIIWDDDTYAFGPEYIDTRGSGTGEAPEIIIDIPVP